MKPTIINLKQKACILLALLALAACDDYLDETPKGKVIPETIDDYGMMLDDATNMSGSNTIAHGVVNSMTMDDDILIGDGREGEFYIQEPRAYCWLNQIYQTGRDDYDYSRFYRVIYLCNYILANVDDAPEGTGQFSRSYVRGAALFHRAFAYLHLVNLYAKPYDTATATTDLGVPLTLEADPNQRLERSTVQAVYDQVLADLKEAEEGNLLPDATDYAFRPTRPALYALLSRAYLWMGRYEDSYRYAVKARELCGEPADYNELEISMFNPDYGLDGDWISSFTDTYLCPDILCYKKGSYCNWVYYYNVSDDLLATFDMAGDLRYRLFITPYEWFDFFNYDEYGLRISCIYDFSNGPGRGEVYITEAETAVRTGHVSEALAALNALRSKRYNASTYEPVTETDPEALLTLILEERRRELMFKGLRWFDMRRLAKEGRYTKTVTHTLGGQDYTLAPNSPRYVMQFPQSVIDANPRIEQND